MSGVRRSDLDDVGAELGRKTRSKRRDDEGSDLDDADALKRSSHRPTAIRQRPFANGERSARC